MLSELLRDFTKGYYDRAPMLAVNGGLHDYDGRLPDFGPDGIRMRVAWLEETRARAMEIDVEGLSPEERLHRDHKRAHIEPASPSPAAGYAQPHAEEHGQRGRQPDQ